MKKQKLIILYGFAASGKTTLSKMYLDEHPLAMCIESDQIIGMIGQWRKNEAEAQELVFEHIKSIIEKHLHAGHDVLLPCLLSNSTHPEIFQTLTQENGADFCEIYIKIDKENAVNRLLERGCWGEEGSKKLTEADREELTNRYEDMENLMEKRKDIRLLSSEIGKIRDTYQKFIKLV